MRFWIYLVLIIGSSEVALSQSDHDTKCEKILAVIGDIKPDILEQLYLFKEGHAQWRENGEHRGAIYSLEPREMVTYQFSWTAKSEPQGTSYLGDGSLMCEVPASWKLIISSPLSVEYPQIAHKRKQDLVFHDIETVAGIYLGKSKYAIQPDIAAKRRRIRNILE